jgi:hypothetical protein
MSDADEYRNRSAQCFRLAATAGSRLERDVMLNAAAVWMTLANQADRDRARVELREAHAANAPTMRRLA